MELNMFSRISRPVFLLIDTDLHFQGKVLAFFFDEYLENGEI